MGTTYNVIAVAPAATSSEKLDNAIKASLERVNKHLSNWDPVSEISRFNADQSTAPIAISDMMVKVLAAANSVHRESQGQFDVTLAPLIEVWGFGTRKVDTPRPSPEMIATARARVGQLDKLTLNTAAKTLLKRDPSITINLSAIAKGFGVDEVARTLKTFKISNFMVEIGGDLVTSGLNPRGQKWRIGIERPDAGSQRVQTTIDISGHGMATSGDYRNYREHNGTRYSHIINPRTGEPVTHRTASVTVLAQDAMLADAWATALLVLGKDEGMKVARRQDIAALFIFRDPEQAAPDAGGFGVLMSPRFEDIKGQSAAKD